MNHTVSLRLGHGLALTVHRTVIHSQTAAHFARYSLRLGHRLALAVHRTVIHYQTAARYARYSSSGRRRRRPVRRRCLQKNSTPFRLVLIRMFWECGRGELCSSAGDRRSPLRIHINFGRDVVFSANCDIMGLAKSLSLWERWRRSRRRGLDYGMKRPLTRYRGSSPRGRAFGYANP